ncbi:MBL fold metallo-hydrolase [Methanolacinia paynteri]|uniref:MBL fold metallo-hydrolase n=1 Tax=Methanolacinia paynteri TaxID=230356 RepID=UPI00064F6295|nr:MBL fold metallo-hydrolase [Methanolacinia paynteri]
MKITILGTGDTVGTPRVGCDCGVCTLATEEGRSRLRTSFLIENEGKNILIDTSPDLKEQLIRTGAPKIGAVLWTHAHYDHIAGFNEFYRVQDFPPAYTPEKVMDDISGFFHFLRFKKNIVEPYEPFILFGMEITFVTVNHPPIDTYGIVIRYNGKKIGYTSDTNPNLPERTVKELMNCDLLFLDALMLPDVHIGKHMNIAEAEDLAQKLSPKEYYFVHMSHRIPMSYPHAATDFMTFEF